MEFDRLVRENLIAALVGKDLAHKRWTAARDLHRAAVNALEEAERVESLATEKLNKARDQVHRATANKQEADYIIEDATERADKYLKS